MTSTSTKAAAVGHGHHRRNRRAMPAITVAHAAVAGGNVKSSVEGSARQNRRGGPTSSGAALVDARQNGRGRPLSSDFTVGALVEPAAAGAPVPPLHPIAPHTESTDAIATAETPCLSGSSSNHRRSERGHQVRRLGAKAGSGVLHTIINQMPPHRVYIEPFLGWASVMKAKVPADRNIGIDINAERIAEAMTALPSAELTIGDGIRFLKNFRWQGGEMVYCDPPYLLETRTSKSRYEFELSDHTRLLDVLLSLPCPVMLSGYHSTLYSEALREWRAIEYNAPTRGGWRTEVLWCSFPEPLELHDYRYLGNGYRERQNIKRKIQRWSKKLAAMPMLERQALMAAIQKVHLAKSK